MPNHNKIQQITNRVYFFVCAIQIQTAKLTLLDLEVQIKDTWKTNLVIWNYSRLRNYPFTWSNNELDNTILIYITILLNAIIHPADMDIQNAHQLSLTRDFVGSHALSVVRIAFLRVWKLEILHIDNHFDGLYASIISIYNSSLLVENCRLLDCVLNEIKYQNEISTYFRTMI